MDKLEKSNLINEHALNREPVPLMCAVQYKGFFKFTCLNNVPFIYCV